MYGIFWCSQVKVTICKIKIKKKLFKCIKYSHKGGELQWVKYNC